VPGEGLELGQLGRGHPASEVAQFSVSLDTLCGLDPQGPHQQPRGSAHAARLVQGTGVPHRRQPPTGRKGGVLCPSSTPEPPRQHRKIRAPLCRIGNGAEHHYTGHRPWCRHPVRSGPYKSTPTTTQAPPQHSPLPQTRHRPLFHYSRRGKTSLISKMAKTARIELRVDEAFTHAVADLAKRTRRSKAEVIRDAMNLYIKAIDEWEKGREIVFEPIKEAGENGAAPKTAGSKNKIVEPCLA
jgi:hypothetical protein